MSGQTSNSDVAARTSSESLYVILASVPLAFLIGILLLGGLQETLADVQLDAEIEARRSDGVPTNNHEMTRLFDEMTSRENSRGWRDVFNAQRGLGRRFDRLATDFVQDFTRLVPPGQPWDAEPIAKAYAEEAAPILAAIEKLVADDEPVWQPVLFVGYGTLMGDLQESRDTNRLLAAEFRVAVHAGDHARAMRSLELLEGLSDAFDWRIGWVSYFVTAAHRATHHQLIRDSLAFDFWTAEELTQLRERLKPFETLDSQWQQAIAFEEAMGLVTLDSGEGIHWMDDFAYYPFGVAKVAKLRFVQDMNRTRELVGVGTLSHMRQTERLESKDNRDSSSFAIASIPLGDTDVIIGPFQSSYRRIANSFVRNERERRWTRTAVAVKEFQLNEGRWPKKLNELASIGLAQSDWMATDRALFGYTVVDDAEAILWQTDLTGAGSDEDVPALPPDADDYSTDMYQAMVAHLGTN